MTMEVCGLDRHQQPGISCVRNSTIAISKYLERRSTVVLESTTYPGTTEELLKPILEKGSGLKCGEDFYLGFSPERIDPGNLVYKTSNAHKVVGAIGQDAVEVIAMVCGCGVPVFDCKNVCKNIQERGNIELL